MKSRVRDSDIGLECSSVKSHRATALLLLTDPSAKDSVEIVRKEPRPSRRIDPQDTPQVEVQENRAITHPLALRIDKSILRSKKDERGVLQPSAGRVVPLRVTQQDFVPGLEFLMLYFMPSRNDVMSLSG